MKTILLADDSITIQKVVELTFSDGDYRVFCVANGAQALRKIPEVRPDVVLLDIVMPEKNGYEVCEALQADPATASIPVLLLTGTFEPFDQTRAEAAGARGHVTKPVESHTLVQRVEELLAQGPARGRLAAAPAPTASGPIPSPASGATPRAPAASAATEPAADSASPFAPTLSRPVNQPTGPHPVLVPPEPDTGGAYLGFADLAIGEEETVVRDRYDEMDAPASPDANASGSGAGESMEGFVSGYDMPASTTPPPRGQEPRTPAGVAPRPAPGAPPAPAETAAAPAARGDESIPSATLSPEALDRLADLVVRRMSERVVREIAWEVIPGVAESVVRERIKELEEREG